MPSKGLLFFSSFTTAVSTASVSGFLPRSLSIAFFAPPKRSPEVPEPSALFSLKNFPIELTTLSIPPSKEANAPTIIPPNAITAISIFPSMLLKIPDISPWLKDLTESLSSVNF